MKKFGKTSIASAIVLGLMGTGLAGCTATEESAKNVTLVVGNFGDMGMKDLFETYMDLNPNIEIVEKSSEFNAHHQGIITSLAAGKGNDIQAVEIGWMPTILPYAEEFVDLNEYDAASLKKDYFEWRWNPAVADTGAVIGLPTDVGGMAIAYRTDLFAEAGLPTDPTEVAALWDKTGWNGYLATARKYKAETGKLFADTVEGVWSAVLNQNQTTFYDANGDLVYESSEGVQDAWNIATEAAQFSSSAKYWTPEWNAAQATAATVIAPAWMLTGIKTNNPDLAGKWNITTVPGTYGNWGGSYLTVPKYAPNQKEAVELVKWLLAPEQQKTLFVTKNLFPSAITAANDETVLAKKDPYFSDAEVAKIYVKSYSELVAAYTGPKQSSVGTTFRDALFTVVDGKNSKDEAWEAAIAEIRKNVGESK